MKSPLFRNGIVSGMSKEHVQECQTTEFTAYQYDFVWKLENWALIFPMSTPKSFKSEQFSLDKTKQLCSLKLDIDCESSILTVSVTASDNTSVTLLIQVLIIIPSCGKKFSSSHNTVIVNKQEVTSHFALLHQNTDRHSRDCLRNYEENDTLTFKIIIKDIRESCTAEKPITIPNYKMKMATDMFTSFYRNNELFDVTLITGKERIQAHALVLSAISPYFRKMFSSGMKEERERTVDFSKDDEITPKILRGLLDYIYGFKSVDELKDIARDLLTLALKFDIENLKEPCEFIVSNGINKTNVASTLLFAHKYDLKILKEKALNISKIHMKDLKASKEFEEICQQVDLVKELM